MADNIPPSLRQADITIWKCATKAAQLQTVKPIIAYWCEYWVVNQILAKQLHTTGEDVLLYTTSLMDKLEQTKAEYPNEAAILDDAAGQAYVEQFAQETLDRAERVVKANKVSQYARRQTATTFDAAATFFHLVNIWGPADQETQQKIKYAKWNAARIAKAIKEGKDPNESNPKQEDIQQPTLDPEDPDVQRLTGPSSHLAPRPATVEEVPDVDLPRDAAGVSLPHSPASVVPLAVSDGELHLPGVPTTLGEPAVQPGYFDSEPSPVSPAAPHDSSGYQTAPTLPPPPAGWAQPQPSPDILPPPAAWSQDPRVPPPAAPGWGAASNFNQAPTAPPTFATAPPSTAAVASPPVNPPTDAYYMNMRPTAHTAKPAVPQMTAAQNYASAAVDEAAMVGAQKHAKWAISALNFEDVPTAVRELRKALEMLGAS
ncbi:Vta1 like-domain-containing protein [Cercophora scortea]|uniref:Vta1 like-domain-containing protein n=1 Tax=Cercophora scortea TaxID=314031 RepID=A0AAE0J2S6_9PEZI|nr:Vta1 like-domain-containing protein [Cercophora scortea]